MSDKGKQPVASTSSPFPPAQPQPLPADAQLLVAFLNETLRDKNRLIEDLQEFKAQHGVLLALKAKIENLEKLVLENV